MFWWTIGRGGVQAAEEWLWEVPDDADASVYREKFAELKAKSGPIYTRVSEAEERPKVINATASVANHTRHMLKRFAKEKPWLPEADTKALKDKVSRNKERGRGRG